MSGGGGEAFAASRERFGELAGWLEGGEAAGLTAAELEDRVQVSGRELLRQLLQDHLDLREVREDRQAVVAGADGVERTRAETGHGRALASVLGEVTVTRIAYRAPGAANLHPADAALNLPEEKHSHGLRKLAAIEAARGSFESAGQAIGRATGTVAGKRQVEQLAVRAAADIDGFYAARRPGPAARDVLLVMSYDGKGIVMRPGALREATAKAAASAGASWPPGSRRERRTAVSGWPSWRPYMTPSPCRACPPTSSRRRAAASRRRASAARWRRASG